MKYRILYPESRLVTEEQLMLWAKDDIANGDSHIFEQPDDVRNVYDAIRVLNDSGTITVQKF